MKKSTSLDKSGDVPSKLAAKIVNSSNNNNNIDKRHKSQATKLAAKVTTTTIMTTTTTTIQVFPSLLRLQTAYLHPSRSTSLKPKNELARQ